MPQGTLHCVVLVVVLCCLPAYAQSAPQSQDEKALTAATQGLCHVQIAMLGESATHGDGHTDAFKVALVERLVDQCGFEGVLFEASHYEFIHLNRQLHMGQPVTPAEVLAAVGGLWEFNQEFQPLPPFLLARAKAAKVFLGGIDDQIGERGQDYANVGMITELTSLLPREEQQTCSTVLHRRIFYDYTTVSQYSKSDREQIETCLLEMRRANIEGKRADRQVRAERQEMISSAQRWISRDFSPDAEDVVNRDRSMFQNFEWLLRQHPMQRKVIIWAATVHLAKQADPAWGDHTGMNLGSLVHGKYGDRAFSLGFSALTGSYKSIGQRGAQLMPAAPPDSVEAEALRGNHSDAIYLGPAQLAARGTASGAFFYHSWQTLPWSTFIDGVVVFREERPPRGASGMSGVARKGVLQRR